MHHLQKLSLPEVMEIFDNEIRARVLLVRRLETESRKQDNFIFLKKVVLC